MSLVDRCKHFKMEFPTASMNTALLRKIYKMNSIKKRKYRWFKRAKDHDPEKQRRDYITMKRELTRARNQGCRIVYIDETCFTRKTMVDTEWCLPK